MSGVAAHPPTKIYVAETRIHEEGRCRRCNPQGARVRYCTDLCIQPSRSFTRVGTYIASAQGGFSILLPILQMRLSHLSTASLPEHIDFSHLHYFASPAATVHLRHDPLLLLFVYLFILVLWVGCYIPHRRCVTTTCPRTQALRDNGFF